MATRLADASIGERPQRQGRLGTGDNWLRPQCCSCWWIRRYSPYCKYRINSINSLYASRDVLEVTAHAILGHCYEQSTDD